MRSDNRKQGYRLDLAATKPPHKSGTFGPFPRSTIFVFIKIKKQRQKKKI